MDKQNTTQYTIKVKIKTKTNKKIITQLQMFVNNFRHIVLIFSFFSLKIKHVKQKS